MREAAKTVRRGDFADRESRLLKLCLGAVYANAGHICVRTHALARQKAARKREPRQMELSSDGSNRYRLTAPVLNKAFGIRNAEINAPLVVRRCICSRDDVVQRKCETF